VVLTLLALALGCGESGNPDLIPVTGTVRYAGQPVAGANVAFRSENSMASAMTDSSGRFELTAVEQGTGAMPGKYKVIVAKIAAVETAMQDMEEALNNPPSAEQAAPKNELPAQYADFETTPLEYTVTGGQTNDFTIELEQ